MVGDRDTMVGGPKDHRNTIKHDSVFQFSKIYFQDKENGVAEETEISLHEQHYP